MKWVSLDTVQAVLVDLHNKIWDVDIPSPTVPEYIEHHEQMQELMNTVREMLLFVEKESRGFPGEEEA